MSATKGKPQYKDIAYIPEKQTPLVVVGHRAWSYKTAIRDQLDDGRTIGNITEYTLTTTKHQQSVEADRCDILLDNVPLDTDDLKVYYEQLQAGVAPIREDDPMSWRKGDIVRIRRTPDLEADGLAGRYGRILEILWRRKFINAINVQFLDATDEVEAMYPAEIERLRVTPGARVEDGVHGEATVVSLSDVDDAVVVARYDQDGVVRALPLTSLTFLASAEQARTGIRAGDIVERHLGAGGTGTVRSVKSKVGVTIEAEVVWDGAQLAEMVGVNQLVLSRRFA